MEIEKGFFKSLAYLKLPEYSNPIKTGILPNIKYLLSSYFLCFACIFATVFLILITDKLLVSIFGIESIFKELQLANKNRSNSFGAFTFIIVVLLVPILEELIFRLSLDLKRTSFAIAISILYFRFSATSIIKFNFLNKYDIIRLVSTILIFIFIQLILPNDVLNRIKKYYYVWWFYGVAILFGAVHIMNFNNINYYILPIYFIYVLPQIIMGIFIGNIRIQRGFFWGIVLHSLINASSFVFN